MAEVWFSVLFVLMIFHAFGGIVWFIDNLVEYRKEKNKRHEKDFEARSYWARRIIMTPVWILWYIPGMFRGLYHFAADVLGLKVLIKRMVSEFYDEGDTTYCHFCNRQSHKTIWIEDIDLPVCPECDQLFFEARSKLRIANKEIEGSLCPTCYGPMKGSLCEECYTQKRRDRFERQQMGTLKWLAYKTHRRRGSSVG